MSRIGGHGGRLRGGAWLLLALLLLVSFRAGAADIWHAPDCPVRFEFWAIGAPSHPGAGYFVEVPDGGLLPGPQPVTSVYTEEGTAVDSFTLWHHPGTRLAMVFAGGGSRRFFVYVKGDARYRLWSPTSGLTPGVIQAVETGRASLDAARALARLGRVGPSVHFALHPGVPIAPLSVGIDPSGRPKPASFYMLSHVITPDPGRTWIAPVTIEGEGAVMINGAPLKMQQKSGKPGGRGDWVTIQPGPNRVEFFHMAPGAGPFELGQVYLCWRTPNMPASELGGGRGDNTAFDARVVAEGEILRSGACELRGARMRNGSPVAAIRHAPAKVFWFGNEEPLLMYKFEAITAGQPDGTRYLWEFDDGATFEGPVVEWMVTGFKEHSVRLTVAGAAGRSSRRMPFYSFSPQVASMNQAGDRRDFRLALWNMARAYPERDRRVANWSSAYWRNMMRTVDLGRGAPLLAELFKKHQAALAAHVSEGQLEALQDVFLDVAARLDAEGALAWLNTFREGTRVARRKEALTAREAEIQLYYRNAPEAARKVLVADARRNDAAGQTARIRLGDIALLEGDLNLATRYYAEVQNLARIERGKTVDPLGVDDAAPAQGRATAQQRMAGLMRQMGRPLIGAGMDEASGEWKIRAMLDVSAAETVRSLIDQGYLMEAREALRIWEQNMPLAKIGGEYIVLEALLYRKINDPGRAVRLLKAFCDTVESSSYLPEAAKMLLPVMGDAGIPDAEIRAYGEKLKKKLEYHPVAKELDHYIPVNLPATPVAGEADDV